MFLETQMLETITETLKNVIFVKIFKYISSVISYNGFSLVFSFKDL